MVLKKSIPRRVDSGPDAMVGQCRLVTGGGGYCILKICSTMTYAAHTNCKTVLRSSLKKHDPFPPPHDSETLVEFLKKYEQRVHKKTNFVFDFLSKQDINGILPEKYNLMNKDKISPCFNSTSKTKKIFTSSSYENTVNNLDLFLSMKVKKDPRKTFKAIRHVTLFPTYNLTENGESVAIML